MASKQAPSKGWMIVIPILFLEFLVLSLPAGVLPIMINEHFGARSYILLGYAQAAKGLLAFLASPALGAISDVVGRKYLFVACVVGSSAPYAILGLGATLYSHIIAVGMSGALAATFPLCFAYISDTVQPQSRASAFGTVLGIGMGGAYLIGPIVGTMMESHFGAPTLFGCCLFLTLLNAAFALVAMREAARPPPPSTAELLRRSNPFAAFGMLRHNFAMRLLCAIVFFYYFALWGFIANKGIYARRRFGQTARQTAEQLTLFGLVSALSQSVGLKAARRRFSEPQIARFCFLCAVLALLLYGMAQSVAMLYPPMALLGLSLGGFATISSLASQVVPQAISGEAQGVLASMKAIMEGVGPMFFAFAMTAAEETPLPGAPWLFGAGCVAVSLGLCFQLERYTDDAKLKEDYSNGGFANGYSKELPKMPCEGYERDDGRSVDSDSSDTREMARENDSLVTKKGTKPSAASPAAAATHQVSTSAAPSCGKRSVSPNKASV